MLQFSPSTLISCKQQVLGDALAGKETANYEGGVLKGEVTVVYCHSGPASAGKISWCPIGRAANGAAVGFEQTDVVGQQQPRSSSNSAAA